MDKRLVVVALGRGEEQRYPPKVALHLASTAHNGTCLGGGGDSRKSDIMLKTPSRAKFKKRGVLGGGFKGVFHCAGALPAGRAPRPTNPPPPPMKYIVSGTSEKLGMRPRCDPTIRTAPTNVYGRVS